MDCKRKKKYYLFIKLIIQYSGIRIERDMWQRISEMKLRPHHENNFSPDKKYGFYPVQSVRRHWHVLTKRMTQSEFGLGISFLLQLKSKLEKCKCGKDGLVIWEKAMSSTKIVEVEVERGGVAGEQLENLN